MATVNDSEQLLTALELCAVKVLGRDADKRRDEVSVGKGQTVDVSLRLKGFIDVGDETKMTTRTKPSGTAMLALVFELLAKSETWDELKNQITSKKAMSVDEIGTWMAKRLSDQIIASFTENSVFPTTIKEHELRAKDVVEQTTSKKENPRRGLLKGTLEVETLDLSAVSSKTVIKMTRKIEL